MDLRGIPQGQTPSSPHPMAHCRNKIIAHSASEWDSRRDKFHIVKHQKVNVVVCFVSEHVLMKWHMGQISRPIYSQA